ncbi:hypothetical protein XPA_003161 [Xanthoria parietina]
MPPSTNHETTVNITFGIAAALFSLLTLWQAHRFWGIFRRHGHHAPRSNDDAGLGAADVELAAVSTRASTAVDEMYVVSCSKSLGATLLLRRCPTAVPRVLIPRARLGDPLLLRLAVVNDFRGKRVVYLFGSQEPRVMIMKWMDQCKKTGRNGWVNVRRQEETR